MSEFSTVLNAVIPVFAIMAAGLVIRRLNWLSEEADQSLFRVVINLLMPCLILDTAAGNPAFNNVRNLFLAPVVGGVTVALSVVVVWFGCGWMNFSGTPARRTFALTTGLQNYAYVPLPLTLLLFDDRTTGVLFLHNVGVEACLWSLLLLLLTGGHAGGAWKHIFNAPLFSVILALGLNFTGAMAHTPVALVKVLHLLGQCAFPLALMLVGATIADHLGELRSGEGWLMILPALVLRTAVLPLGLLLLAKYLPASVELKRVLVIQAAMPAAVVPIVMARHYGGDPALALRIVLASSVVSLMTTPLWIKFGLKFVFS
ncbi:MAG: AEC family transporter [Verrucomicrobiae bacterium]|nr:AEC family transporter [Verrucomicrobiae bacterium]MCP5533497.1 AEC family transporter [Akkermansiaceae bacterium]MCP5544488.1 AEC family transporter [Akkermansiaceae bacterium]MCP5546460.1 AEC family transporter [Akkermansiaceae bacterium]